MTKPIEPPTSWRDLTHAELVTLLERRLVLLSPADLVWAQWEVASNAHLAAMKAEQDAYTAEWAAFEVWRQKKTSKTLAAHEEATARTKRRTATMERLRRRADALYALHDRMLSEAARS